MNSISKTSPDILKVRLEQFKKLFPDLFTNENQLDEDELRSLLSQFTTPQTERYEFRWAGKAHSKKLAFTPSKATLVPDEARSVDFDKTENIIIEGDNLEVLKLLQKPYFNQIKCIYIDPPYNTGNDFIYNDDYSESKKAYWEKNGGMKEGVKLDSNAESAGRYHSNWLSMMQSRLLLARNLLKEDGLIFISIDDHEVANLRKLMDEVFGEENFEGHIHWRRRHNQPNDPTKLIALVAEHILVYSKNSQALKDAGVGKLELTGKFSNPDKDPRGDWNSKPWKVGSNQNGSKYSITLPTGNVVEAEWMGDINTYKQLIKDKRIYFPKDGQGLPRKKYLNLREKKKVNPRQIG